MFFNHPRRRFFVFVTCLSLFATATISRADDLKRRGIVGVQLAPLPDGEPGKGALIQGVMPGTPAQTAGLEDNDIVIKVGKVEVADLPALLAEFRKYYGGDDMTLTVKRGDKTVEKTLTLTPRPKETSTDFDVIYDAVNVQGLRLRTYITKPKKGGKHPAVLFISSPVPQPIEFPPQAAKHPFKQTMDMLTNAGIVTMRVERVGIGDSEGRDPQKTPLATDIETYRNAVKKLQTYDYVDAKNVYIFSFGMGSAVAPLAADGAQVKGVASYAATVMRPWSQGMVEQAKRGWALHDGKETGYDERAKAVAKFVELCQKPGVKPLDVLNDHPELKEAAESIGGPVTNDAFAGIDLKYFQDIAATDYAKAWAGLNAEVLSLWGEADFQANRGDCEMIAKVVNDAHAGRAKFVALPQVDHVFNKADDQEDSYLSGYQGGEFNPVAAKTIIKWIQDTSRNEA